MLWVHRHSCLHLFAGNFQAKLLLGTAQEERHVLILLATDRCCMNMSIDQASIQLGEGASISRQEVPFVAPC
jgi:hypothetical protein